jgi:hypothetical protein
MNGEAVFINDRPAKITCQEFRRHLLASFPKFALPENEGVLQEAIDTVYAMFTGVSELWDAHEKPVWYEKTVTCYRLLVAWFITDTFPALSAGVPSMGGLPLTSKKVDGVSLGFADIWSKSTGDVLAALKTNAWGQKAYLMISSAPKRYRVRNYTDAGT